MKISIKKAVSEAALVELEKKVDLNEGWNPTPDVVLLDASSQWILAAAVDRLDADGYYVFFRSIVRCLRRTRHDAFRKGMMTADGAWTRVMHKPAVDLTNIRTILQSVQKLEEFTVLLRETFSEWYSTHCRIESVAEDHVAVRGFDGAGQWERNRRRIDIAAITSIQFGSRYLRLYRKYCADQDADPPSKARRRHPADTDNLR